MRDTVADPCKTLAPLRTARERRAFAVRAQLDKNLFNVRYPALSRALVGLDHHLESIMELAAFSAPASGKRKPVESANFTSRVF